MAVLQGAGCACMLCHFSYIQLFATLWTVACQAFLSMRFSRQGYWSGLPCPPPVYHPNPAIEPVPPVSPALAGGFFTTSTIWEAHRVQDTLPQTMIPRHIEHFKLKKFEKWQEQEGLCPSPESGHKTLPQVRGAPCPHTKGEQHSFLCKWSDAGGNLKEQSLLSFLQLTTLSSYPLSCLISTTFQSSSDLV